MCLLLAAMVYRIGNRALYNLFQDVIANRPVAEERNSCASNLNPDPVEVVVGSCVHKLVYPLSKDGLILGGFCVQNDYRWVEISEPAA